MLLDAVVGWLVDAVGTAVSAAGINLVFGSRDERQLRAALAIAVEDVVEEVPADAQDPLLAALRERFSEPASLIRGGQAPLSEVLRRNIRMQIDPLGDPDVALGGRSFLDDLGVDAEWFCAAFPDAVINAIMRVAAASGSLAPLAAQLNFDRLRGDLAGLRAASGISEAREIRSRPVMECDPFWLGVHHAIRVPDGSTDGAQDESLPRFVVRAHDQVLRDEVASAAVGCKLIMLVGSSSTGKTRSAVEAIRSVLPDWRLLYPLTAMELTALIARGHVSAQTILWLNETQIYLEGSDGADAAAALRGLLAGAQPFLVVGTLWPEYWLAYMRPPEFGAPDSYGQARQLLETAVKVDIPDRFGEQDLEQARRLAANDPRLAVALTTHHGHGVTQVLAGGPDLIDRWHNAPDSYGRAVITAAIDARRLGYLSAMPAEMLQAVAVAYLGGPQRAAAPPDWFGAALAYACEPVKGAIAPLTATSRAIGQVDGYLLADYLDQHGRTARCGEPVADSLWTALAAHARLGADLSRLGTAAANRGRYQHACTLWAAARQNGDMSMAMSLRYLLSRAGHHAEAEQVLWQAAEAGDQEGLARLAALLRREERHRELEQLLRRAFSAGHLQAAHDLAILLLRTGRSSEAEQVIRRLIAAGDQHGWHLLAILLNRAPQPEHTEDPLPHGAEKGETAQLGIPRQPDALEDHAAGQEAEADRLLPGRDPAANNVDRPARRKSVARRDRRSASAFGERENLPARIRAAMERQKALEARMQPAAPQEPQADESIGNAIRQELQIRGKPGLRAETPSVYWRRMQAHMERSLRDLADSGDVNAERELAIWLVRAKRISEGEHLLRTAAIAGDAASLRLLAKVLLRTGRAREASMLARYGLTEDGSTAAAW